MVIYQSHLIQLFRWRKVIYISLLDHDDILPPNALFEVVDVINKNPDVDLIYTDEDKIDSDGIHIEPFFKLTGVLIL